MMAKLNGFLPRFAGAAAIAVTALVATTASVKPAAAGNDYWRHNDWHNNYRQDYNHSSGSVYFGAAPSYYCAPPPAYHPPAPGYYYPAPQPFYPAPAPSFGFSVRAR
jgi:hypothetical protein